MKKVLILAPYYIPGYKSGGPQQTVTNISNAYGNVCDIYILTRNHDFNEKKEYENITDNKWLEVEKSKVKYLKEKNFNLRYFLKEYKEFNTIYTCGLFEKNTILVLLIHRFIRDKRKDIYVAPMGVFSKNAIKSKGIKKKVFLFVFKFLGIFKDIKWSFSSLQELNDAFDCMKKVINNYIIAEDLPKKVKHDVQRDYIYKSYNKEKKHLKVIFLSRISYMKNLIDCMKILKHNFSGKIMFDIYGIVEDIEYWNKCKELSLDLPLNVNMNYCGEVKPEKVIETFQKYDVFLFPTKGENYGHVIYEALSAGCLPIISDKTTWNDIEINNCGSVIKNDDIIMYQRELQKYLDYDEEKIKELKINAINYAESKYIASMSDSGYKVIFI